MYLKIKKEACGRWLGEYRIKQGLKRLNPRIFFDLGSKLNLPHPDMDICQGVFYDGWPAGRKHVCTMDRGEPGDGGIPETPIWKLEWDLIAIDNRKVRPGEFALYNDDGVTAMVKRQVRGELVRVGWRHVFNQCVKKRIPGITAASLNAEFNMNCFDCYIEEVDIDADPDVPEGDSWDCPDFNIKLDENDLKVETDYIQRSWSK